MISRFKIFFCALLVLQACGKPMPSTTSSKDGKGQQQGTASWYGGKFHGRATASGEIYDQDLLTAAHRYAPFHTMVRVTNLSNGQSVRVKINDRGPFVKGRIIDLSREAAKQIGMISTGTARVRLDFEGLTPQAQSRQYYIQAGSFSDAENAQFQKQAISRAFPALPIQVVNNKGLYRIQVGKYANKDEATRDRNRLRKQKFDGIVLQFP